MATLTVGAGEEFSTLSAAVTASHNGDVIQVKAGTYVNDFATVTDSITIESVGGMANFVATEPPTDLKAILTVGTSSPSNIDVTVDGLSFSGAAISAADGANAAGIKEQSGNLTVENCLFQNNQMGILTGNLASSSITVEHSEFAGQSTLPGYLAHQLYVGQIGSAVIEDNLFLANDSGHQIKDRAATSLIENNVIDDGSGHTSYDIDLPNGGNATVSGNEIIKGPNDPNTTVISYGEEGMIWSSNSLSITGNVIDNKLTGNHGIGLKNYSSVVAHIDDNQFYHLPTVATGPNEQTGNVTLTSEPKILDTNPIQLSSSGVVAAQPPILSVAAASGKEGNAIPIAITAKQAASTLSPADLSVTVSNLDGATLNHGTHNADGSYTLHSADLAGLTLTPSKGFVGTIPLDVVATDSEPSSNTVASSAAETLDVTVTALSVTPPPPSSGTAAEAPILSVTDASGKEGNAISLAITAKQAASTLSPSDLTVTVSNLDGATLSHGTHNADGSYTLHVADLTGLTLTPSKGFVGTIPLHVVATDTEPSSHTSAASAPATLDVTVTAPSTGSTGPGTPPSTTPHLSPNGAELTAGSSGQLVTSDGTWSFSAKTAEGGHLILLNGQTADSGAATTLIVEQGHLFADNAQGHWSEWINSSWKATTNPVSTTTTAPAHDPAPASTIAPTFSDGAGHDIFVFKSIPSTAEHIANFTSTDILDLAPLLKAAGDTGTNGDHVVSLVASGSNSTAVMVDPTGHDPNHGHVLVTLDHVMPVNVHAANIWT